MKGVISNWYRQLYANKLENLDEINRFLGTQSLPKLSHEEKETLNRTITKTEVESGNKDLPSR